MDLFDIKLGISRNHSVRVALQFYWEVTIES